jgi:hypothetical protein
MKRPLPVLFVLFSIAMFAQQNAVTGGYYSVWQYYTADSVTHFSPPAGRWRSMNYFTLHYKSGDWELGAQLESYLPQALLGYNPSLKRHLLTGYYARYRKNNWDVTAGFVYDQFGSGLVFRTWEDRQIGINNALLGAAVRYEFPGLKIALVSGNPRTAMEISKASVTAADVQTDLNVLFENLPAIRLGFSVLSKFEEPQTPNVPATVQMYSARTRLFLSDIDFEFEYVYKTPDALFSNGVLDDLVLFDGDAYLLNAGYSVKGFGTNLTLRRAENIQLYAERELTGNPYNTGILNYVPSLTKQHDYLLTNLFVYSTQQNISFAEQTVGEIGGQWDVYFLLKRKTFLGGKYGTRVSFNWSRWHGLKSEFMPALHTYRREFFQPGDLYYQDINLEIKRKINKRLKTGLLVMQQDYNRRKIEGHGEMLHNFIVVTDWQYRLKKLSSVRVEAEHLWNKGDEGNWLAGAMEFNWHGKLGIYIADRFNYGNKKIHYYSAGLSYEKDGNRLALSYGRERGGLICVGGVCRYVPPNTGLQFSISLNF